jgi:hypothetical protein
MLQGIRTMTKEASRFRLLASTITEMPMPTLECIADVHKIDYTINGGSTNNDHDIVGKPRFGPALVEAIDRMTRLQMSCDVTVNNGGDPSNEFVQAMKLLWRQPLQLYPAFPNVSVAFPKISEPGSAWSCAKMDVRIICV